MSPPALKTEPTKSNISLLPPQPTEEKTAAIQAGDVDGQASSLDDWPSLLPGPRNAAPARPNPFSQPLAVAGIVMYFNHLLKQEEEKRRIQGCMRDTPSSADLGLLKRHKQDLAARMQRTKQEIERGIAEAARRVIDGSLW
jgi:hypothetical protein